MQQALIIRRLGLTEFDDTCQAMQHFTSTRTANSPDELWLTEHPRVYTIGLNRKEIRAPSRDDIPVIHTDRGGKITYHGPGQVIIYVLLNMARRNIKIRELVNRLEESVIELLREQGIEANARGDAPGVYVKNGNALEAKIASLGLRVKNNCCYHGLSLNIEMDLTPFDAIDPCGYAGLPVTQTKDLGIKKNTQEMGELLLKKLSDKLDYLRE
jgi:lipoyl(octanoyl) transferase